MEFAVRTLVQMQTLLLTFVVYEKFNSGVFRVISSGIVGYLNLNFLLRDLGGVIGS